MVKFYVNGELVLSDDPRLVVYQSCVPRPTPDDVRLLRYQLFRRSEPLVRLGVFKHHGKMVFSRN